jgi:hypothetical protein
MLRNNALLVSGENDLVSSFERVPCHECCALTRLSVYRLSVYLTVYSLHYFPPMQELQLKSLLSILHYTSVVEMSICSPPHDSGGKEPREEDSM